MDQAYQCPLVALEWFGYLCHRLGLFSAEGLKGLSVHLDLVWFRIGWRGAGDNCSDAGIAFDPASIGPVFRRQGRGIPAEMDFLPVAVDAKGSGIEMVSRAMEIAGHVLCRFASYNRTPYL